MLQQQDYQQQIYFQTMEEVHLPKDIFDEDFKKNESFVSNKVGNWNIASMECKKNLVVQGSNVIQLIGSKCDSISIWTRKVSPQANQVWYFHITNRTFQSENIDLGHFVHGSLSWP